MFAFAVRRGWCARNPVALVEKPRGATQPGHPLSRRAGARGAARGDADRRKRHNRARPVPDRGDDRSSPRRTARAALAGHRLDRRRGARAPQLHARPVRHTEVASLQPRRAARPTRPRRAPAALRAVALPGARPTSSSATPSSASCSTRQSSADASRPQPDEPGSDRSASTICATRSAPAWPPPAHRCDGSRNGSDTATTEPPRSTPTTHPTSPKPPTGPHAPSTTPRPTPTQRPPLR